MGSGGGSGLRVLHVVVGADGRPCRSIDGAFQCLSALLRARTHWQQLNLFHLRTVKNVYLSFQSLGGGGIMPNVASPAKIYPAPKTVQTKMQYAIKSLFSNFFIA